MSAVAEPIESPLRQRRKRPRQETAAMLFFVAAQFLGPGLLFLPGSQQYRFWIRAIPYVSSIVLLAYFVVKKRRSPLPPGAPLIAASLVVLGLNLPRADSETVAGLAQWVFQLSIAAPLFWAGKMVSSADELYRLLRFYLLANTVGTVLGALQVWNPQAYYPRDFSSATSKEYIQTLSYRAADGRRVYRPPGLSDLPGGAAVSGAFTAFTGVMFMSDARLGLGLRLFGLAISGLGVFDIYMSHVRSLLMVTVFAVFVAGILLAAQRRVAQSVQMSVAIVLIVVVAFMYATQLGGQETAKRFLRVYEEGVVESMEENRGKFLVQTFGTLLDHYPLGAGVGRWGMMHVYFAGGQNLTTASYIHAEIQVTGWLLDGGVPMWICYGGGILASMWYSLRLATRVRGKGLEVLAIYVFSFSLLIVAQSFAGPCFNTSLGIQFWALVGALHGAATGELKKQPA